MSNLEQRTVLITGASRGLGFDIALHSAFAGIAFRLLDPRLEFHPVDLEYAEISDNQLLRLRVAELAGRAANHYEQLIESFYQSTLNALRSEDLSYLVFSFSSEEHALDSLERCRTTLAEMRAWHVYAEQRSTILTKARRDAPRTISARSTFLRARLRKGESR